MKIALSLVAVAVLAACSKKSVPNEVAPEVTPDAGASGADAPKPGLSLEQWPETIAGFPNDGDLKAFQDACTGAAKQKKSHVGTALRP